MMIVVYPSPSSALFTLAFRSSGPDPIDQVLGEFPTRIEALHEGVQIAHRCAEEGMEIILAAVGRADHPATPIHHPKDGQEGPWLPAGEVI